MESANDTHWLNTPCAYSPSGSVDSGVELSPSRSGVEHYDEWTELLQNVPATTVNPPVEHQAYDSIYRSPHANQLTPDELEELSDTCSLSPLSFHGQVSPAGQYEEIGPFYNQQRKEAVSVTHNKNKENLVPSDNTQKRKHRKVQQNIDLHKAHPDLHPCMVPKSGTAKPRQSRKRKPSQSSESSVTGQGCNMNNKNGHYLGARVKQTAKERLEELRREKANAAPKNEDPSELPSPPLGQNCAPPPKRPHMMDERFREAPYNTPVTSYAQRPSGNHTIHQILYGELEMCIYEFLHSRNPTLLRQYVQRQALNAGCSEDTPLHTVLRKLHEKKDSFPTQDMQAIAEIVCSSFNVDINLKNLKGETCIYEAALYGNEGVVLALMKYNANPWIQESNGQSALHAAVRSKKVGVVTAVLESPKQEPPRWHSGINNHSNDGNTPLHVATALTEVCLDVKTDIIKMLLQHGADTTKKNYRSELPHSFLVGPGVEKLRAEMKRLSQRRRSVPMSNSTAPPMQASCLPAYSHFNSYYHQEQMLPAHFSPPYQQHYRYAPPSYDSPRYTPITTAPDMRQQYDAFAYPTDLDALLGSDLNAST